VGVLGAGTVGQEVIRMLLEHPERLCAADGAPLVLAGVACRDLDRARRSGIPGHLLTDAPAHVVADPDIDLIVEVMGGDEPARTLIAAALGVRKPVVTANKHVIAHHGPDLEEAARRSDVALRFEAAVGGGIPVLGPLAADLAADSVERVRGIVNGTTNYILSAMTNEGRDYGSALADAQARGYAEADPTGDVEGDDAVNKLVILGRLAFGSWLEPASVERRPSTLRRTGKAGITGVSQQDLAGAAAFNLTIKLLAMARRSADAIEATVLPTAVPSEGRLGRTSGVSNRVEVDAEPLGTIGLDGPGAGGAATSSAVLGDLIAIGRGLGSTWAGLPAAPVGPRAAAAPMAGTRRWFAFVPDAAPGEGVPTTGINAVPVAGGLAVRTASLPLSDARAMVSPMVATGADVTLYPIDD
jgi:homoserine dehydrogenase